MKKWLEDRVIELPSVTTVPTAEDEKHSRFCIYHRKISHSAMDCYVLRDIFDKKIRSGELRLKGNVDANPFPGHKGKVVANMISSSWSPNFEEKIQRGAPCEYHMVDTSEPISTITFILPVGEEVVEEPLFSFLPFYRKKEPAFLVAANKLMSF